MLVTMGYMHHIQCTHREMGVSHPDAAPNVTQRSHSCPPIATHVMLQETQGMQTMVAKETITLALNDKACYPSHPQLPMHEFVHHQIKPNGQHGTSNTTACCAAPWADRPSKKIPHPRSHWSKPTLHLTTSVKPCTQPPHQPCSDPCTNSCIACNPSYHTTLSLIAKLRKRELPNRLHGADAKHSVFVASCLLMRGRDSQNKILSLHALLPFRNTTNQLHRDTCKLNPMGSQRGSLSSGCACSCPELEISCLAHHRIRATLFFIYEASSIEASYGSFSLTHDQDLKINQTTRKWTGWPSLAFPC